MSVAFTPRELKLYHTSCPSGTSRYMPIMVWETNDDGTQIYKCVACRERISLDLFGKGDCECHRLTMMIQTTFGI